MTVLELITKLGEYPPDTRVSVHGTTFVRMDYSGAVLFLIGTDQEPLKNGGGR